MRPIKELKNEQVGAEVWINIVHGNENTLSEYTRITKGEWQRSIKGKLQSLRMSVNRPEEATFIKGYLRASDLDSIDLNGEKQVEASAREKQHCDDHYEAGFKAGQNAEQPLQPDYDGIRAWIETLWHEIPLTRNDIDNEIPDLKTVEEVGDELALFLSSLACHINSLERDVDFWKSKAEQQTPARVPVFGWGYSAAEDHHDREDIVICNDGTMFRFGEVEWQPLPPIPQPKKETTS